MHELTGDRLAEKASRGRTACPDWFDFADAVSERCRSVMSNSVRPPEDVREELAIAMFSRAISSLQAGGLLVSVGMLQEAKVIARSGLEAHILLGAFAADPASVTRYLRSHDARRMSLLKKLENLPGRESYADDAWFGQIRPLATDKALGAGDLKLREFALAGGLVAIYDSLYAVLSAPSHHLPGDVIRTAGFDAEGDRPAVVLDRLTAAPFLSLTPFGRIFGFDADSLTVDLLQRHRALRAA